MSVQEFEYLASLSAFVALAVAMWSRIQVVFSWLSNQVVVEQRCTWALGGLVVDYLSDHAWSRRKGTQYYSISRPFVRPLAKYSHVIFAHIDVGVRFFWQRKKHRMIWCLRSSDPDQPSSCDGNEFSFRFFYVRGTMNWEDLLAEVAAWDGSRDEEPNRFRVTKFFGSDDSSDNELVSSRPKSIDTTDRRGRRPLRWSFDDIGPPLEVSSLDRLSLSQELLSLIDEARFWRESEQWYREHGVPWRRSFGFEGEPGTGKTSMARALAEELNMPVYVFDLGTMSNQDLFVSWTTAVDHSPCMILLEDIDSVFNGRDNISKFGELTFDALLNCIDGADKSDGILLVMTTNRLEKLDSALKRPGRMDRVVTFHPLDREGRLKLAKRILEDEVIAKELADQYLDLSAAEFQEKCFQIAIERYFEHSPSKRAV